MCTHVSSSVTIFANSHLLNLWKNINNCFAVFTRTRFWLSVNIHVQCKRYPEIVHTFEILFKMKCTRDSDMPRTLAMSRVVFRVSVITLNDSPDFCLVYFSHGLTGIRCNFDSRLSF